MTLLDLTIILERQGFESSEADRDKIQVDLGDVEHVPAGCLCAFEVPLTLSNRIT